MLLNLTDGLMGDFVNIKFICTFNTDIKNIDQALLRKGRITCKYEFKKLHVDKANVLLKKQFPETAHVFTEDTSLADIYNFDQNDYKEKSVKKIGFK
jgi:ATP-dependent 26S proteasome regulatory subunit